MLHPVDLIIKFKANMDHYFPFNTTACKYHIKRIPTFAFTHYASTL